MGRMHETCCPINALVCADGLRSSKRHPRHEISASSCALRRAAAEPQIASVCALHSCLLCRRRAADWAVSDRRRVSHPLAQIAPHSWVYVVAVAFAAVAALVLAPQTNFGPVAGLGFLTLAILWLIATGTALRTAIQHRFRDHRRWMLRSYALTAAAITLRILLPASAIVGLPMGPSYRAIAWMCWLINLGIVEIYLSFRPDTASRLPRSIKTRAV
jgi:hypothetical protein